MCGGGGKYGAVWRVTETCGQLTGQTDDVHHAVAVLPQHELLTLVLQVEAAFALVFEETELRRRRRVRPLAPRHLASAGTGISCGVHTRSVHAFIAHPQQPSTFRSIRSSPHSP